MPAALTAKQVRDLLEHITDLEVDRERRRGRGIYRALCGHEVIPGSGCAPSPVVPSAAVR